jgi:hypothetical protein
MSADYVLFRTLLVPLDKANGLEITYNFWEWQNKYKKRRGIV